MTLEFNGQQSTALPSIELIHDQSQTFTFLFLTFPIVACVLHCFATAFSKTTLLVMAELLLGALVPVLIERLASSELLRFAKREKVRDLVNKWETKLRDISMFLEDAEDKAMRGSDGRVQPWLDDLKDLAYDIDDVVDEFITEEGIRSLSKQAASSSKVRSLLVPGFLSPGKLKFDHKLRSRMKEIDGRLKLILDRKRDLGLNEDSSGGMMKGPNLTSSNERLTTSLPEYYVVGREEDERAILAKLLQETVGQHLSVIPIVGMGGVGKTTLARSVFNNSGVIKAFPKRGWACVSDNFDMVGIARALLGSLTGGGGNVDSSDLNVLHNKLGEILSKQKFLIVLDDYWNENYNEWVRLSDLFKLGLKGSKIIVTTRLTNVASIMQTDPTYHRLQELSPGDCLSLLAYHALGGSSFDSHPHLKPIGEKIANKCAGLPLAAKTLGGLLRSKSSTSEWQYILNSDIWNLPQGSDGILPALKLSYFHLPSYAKRCFTFCSIFPQDYEFDRYELVQLWMAEGLVDMRDRGLQQFDVLLSRSFFQRSSQNESCFVMHDLVHDLATSVGGTSYLNVGEGEFDCVKTGKSLEKVRHISYFPNRFEVSARLEKCQNFKGLRTFIALSNEWGNHISDKVAEELLQKLKYLRAFSFSGYFINKIPGSICYLKHLRYLNFSRCPIRELPELICTLYNLETLILKWCDELTELPHGIDKLINLRCLDIEGTNKLKKIPLSLCRLHKLEILSKFIVGKYGGLRLKELKCFKFLQEKLLISDLQNVEEIEEARDAELIDKVGLSALTFEWDIMDDSSARNADKEMHVFELLRPHPNIKEMKIHGFGGTSFPRWIGSPSLVSINSLQLSKCQTTVTLPSLGRLPSLRVLKISEMDAVCIVGHEFFGTAERPFQSLEVLEFKDMLAWESWCFSFGNKEIYQPFPRLNKVTLFNCPKLVSELPHQLSSLIELDIQSCPSISLAANLNALTKITLIGMNSELTYLNKDFLSSLRMIEVLEFDSCDGLIWLWEDNNAEVVTSLARLRCLSVSRCANLQKLPDNMQRLTSLIELKIFDCPKLVLLPEGIMSSSSLEELIIRECGSLICFPEGAMLPTTLKTLKIHECEKLERLPEGLIVIDNGEVSSSLRSKNNTMMTSHQLKELEIINCPSLKLSVNNDMSKKKEFRMSLAASSNLKILEIQNCGNVFDWLLEGGDGDGDDELGHGIHASLKEIKIDGCHVKRIAHPHSLDHMFTNLTILVLKNCLYLEADVFPELPSCLKSLILENCNKIKSLQTTSSLKYLNLSKLSIESLFPKEGVPLSLDCLYIEDCKELRQPMGEWGLHKLTKLKTLVIVGEIGCLQGMTCFPPPSSDWSVLPPNLEFLLVHNQQDLVRLSNGLRNHLTFLRWLYMQGNPKLQFLPVEGFPPSIQYLNFMGCSKDLSCKLSSSNGQYFSLIERIPCVDFDLMHDIVAGK